MTQPPTWNPNPEGEPISYQTLPPYGNAATHVRLAAIFNFISGGFDLLVTLGVAGFIVLTLVVGSSSTPRHPGPAMPPPPGPPELSVQDAMIASAVYGVMGMLSLGEGIVKLIAGVKLLRRSPGARGWGLAAGIIGCMELWCGLGCLLPLAAGIYTIIAMSMESVRRYLAETPPVSPQV